MALASLSGAQLLFKVFCFFDILEILSYKYGEALFLPNSSWAMFRSMLCLVSSAALFKDMHCLVSLLVLLLGLLQDSTVLLLKLVLLKLNQCLSSFFLSALLK